MSPTRLVAFASSLLGSGQFREHSPEEPYTSVARGGEPDWWLHYAALALPLRADGLWTL